MHTFNIDKRIINWSIFIVLSIIWGSSFVLMKEGLKHLSAYQVASIRIVSAGLFLLPNTFKYFHTVPKNKIGIIFFSSLIGNLIPAYLFCIAEEGIDGALAGTLNSLTPIFVIITGALFFNAKTSTNKIIGIAISFAGSILLLISKSNLSGNQNFLYIMCVVCATVVYGFNVNMVHKYLSEIGSLQIAAVALSLNAIPAMIILIITGFFSLPFTNTSILLSTGAGALLGIFGTAIASVIFYKLVKQAGTVFASMVTYGIPIVANIWGIIYNEEVGWKQFLCLAIILFGVYIVNRKKLTS